MRLLCIILILIFSSLFFAEKIFAQLSEADSSFYQSAIYNAVSLYHASAGDQSGLYNGALYRGYHIDFSDGSPFFNSEKIDSGSVFYDGILYKNILLQYNNLNDVIITDDNGYRIELNAKKVAGFTLPGHHFIRIEKDNINSNITTGFYEVLYNGTITVLKKTIKKINEDLSNGKEVLHFITAKDYYYFRKDNVIYPVENKNEAADILSSDKKDILQFIKKNKLNFKKDNENALVQVASYYELIRK